MERQQPQQDQLTEMQREVATNLGAVVLDTGDYFNNLSGANQLPFGD